MYAQPNKESELVREDMLSFALKVAKQMPDRNIRCTYSDFGKGHFTVSIVIEAEPQED